MTRRLLRGQQNQCPSCNEFFSSNAAFDAHRFGTFSGKPPLRRCLSTVEMKFKGMSIDLNGFWRLPASDSLKQWIARRKDAQRLPISLSD